MARNNIPRPLIVSATFFMLLPCLVGPASAGDITTRVSVSSSGAQGNGPSYGQSTSADGRLVAFTSQASNLVGSDTNAWDDVFVHDRLTGETTRVSVNSSGVEGNNKSYAPSISADGHFVAFESKATNLVPGGTNGADHVFVHDRLTGQTTLVSVNSSGTQGNSSSSDPSISADGRLVAFWSVATNLVPGDTNGAYDVFVHDRQTGETMRVSVSSTGTQGDDHSYDASISADGRVVAFWSWASTLVPGDTNGLPDVFVHNRLTGQTTRVSVDPSGTQGNSSSFSGFVSADGRFVGFSSDATNLVAGDTNGWRDVFVHDRQTGQTTLVSVDSNGAQGNSDSGGSSISADGRFVGFSSYATNFVAGDTWLSSDVFVHDRQTGQTTCVSVNSSGTKGNDDSYGPAMSVDGRFAVFSSEAKNLVGGDTNGTSDVFVHGPELSLEADPAVVSAGQTITFTEYDGVPGNPASIWAVMLNNTPIFSLVVISNFAPDKHFVLSGVVPPGLSGYTITFRGYAIGHSGDIVATNDVPVPFQ